MNKFDLVKDTRKFERNNTLRYLEERSQYIWSVLDGIPISNEQERQIWFTKLDIVNELISHVSKY